MAIAEAKVGHLRSHCFSLLVCTAKSHGKVRLEPNFLGELFGDHKGTQSN
jgi:hypothetical protein